MADLARNHAVVIGIPIDEHRHRHGCDGKAESNSYQKESSMKKIEPTNREHGKLLPTNRQQRRTS
jgi:hypothetical protein